VSSGVVLGRQTYPAREFLFTQMLGNKQAIRDFAEVAVLFDRKGALMTYG
jgi:hypothetical protein